MDGGVQWMTAGRGIVHRCGHSTALQSCANVGTPWCHDIQRHMQRGLATIAKHQSFHGKSAFDVLDPWLHNSQS